MNQHTKYIIPCPNKFPKGKSCYYKKYKKCHRIQALMSDQFASPEEKLIIKDLFNSKSKVKAICNINHPMNIINMLSKYILKINYCSFLGTNTRYI